jgi:hypothetical protein
MTALYNQSQAAAITATAQWVILPLIRRVMPSIIAQDIIGVQPMTGAFNSIHSQGWVLRNGYPGRITLTKNHYRHFLRVYNRRNRHHPEYITQLGYSHFKIDYTNRQDAAVWCKQTFKPGSFIISFNDFWFAYERDAMLFSLRWNT